MGVTDNPLIIVGAGGHARIVCDAAVDAGFEIKGIIDISYKNQEEEILGCPVLGDFSTLRTFDPAKVQVAIAIGDGRQRAHFFAESQKSGFTIPTIVHPTAILSNHVQFGKGVFINSGAILNAKALIGEDTIINTGAIIEHEVTVGKHVHIGPGAKIAGRASIGDYSFIGIGTAVIDKVKIGENVTVGAGSVILHDIEANSTVAGVPGKKIK